MRIGSFQNSKGPSLKMLFCAVGDDPVVRVKIKAVLAGIFMMHDIQYSWESNTPEYLDAMTSNGIYELLPVIRKMFSLGLEPTIIPLECIPGDRREAEFVYKVMESEGLGRIVG